MTRNMENEVSDLVPKTQGVKYAGSKLKILPHILKLCREVGINSVFDGFSGTTRVSQALAYSGYTVHSNDISDWSHVFGTCFLLNSLERAHYQPLIDELNHLPPKDGWFTENYGGDTATDKKPWQIHNTRKLDAIREAIDQWALPPIEEATALTSLILAMDEVDSTLGHYASYLRKWSKRSYLEMKLRVPDFQPQPPNLHQITRRNIFDIVSTNPCELAYFDPPYGSNNEKMPPSRVRYAAYYHLWTTICRNDRPELFGKAGRRKDSSDAVVDSVFEDFRKDDKGKYKVITAIDSLIRQTSSPWILLSYSSGGRATSEQLFECIQASGRIEKTLTIDHRRHVMASMRSHGEWLRSMDTPNQEYLFLVRKR